MGARHFGQTVEDSIIREERAMFQQRSEKAGLRNSEEKCYNSRLIQRYELSIRTASSPNTTVSAS